MVLRELLVKLGLDVDKEGFAKGEAQVGAIRHVGELAVDAIKDLAKEFLNSAKEAIEYGDKIKKTSQKIGITTDALQELQYAAQLSDVSADSLSAAIGHLAMNLQNAKEGSEEAAKAFKGIEYKKANGELKSTDELLATIAERFSKLPDGPEKTAQAMRIFGRAGKDLIPLLNDGADGIDELREEARNLGLVLDKDAVEASEELNDNLERLHATTEGLWRQAIGPLLPQINELVKQFLAWRKANGAELAKRIATGMKALIGIVKIAGEVFKSFVFNMNWMIKLVGTGVKNLVTLFGQLGTVGKTVAIAIGTAFLIALAPMAALAALIAGIYLVFDDIAHYQAGKGSLYGRFKKEIDSWSKPNDNDPFWLRWIKDFVRFIQQAIELKKEFDEAMGNVDPKEVDRKSGKNAKEVQAQADAMTLRTARQKAALGLPTSPEARDALARSGVTVDAFEARYRKAAPAGAPTASYAPAPELQSTAPPAAGQSTSTTMIQAPVSIQVVQQPGQDGEALASQIQSKIEEHHDQVMSSADAGVSY